MAFDVASLAIYRLAIRKHNPSDSLHMDVDYAIAFFLYERDMGYKSVDLVRWSLSDDQLGFSSRENI